jgi:hypothetical protein
MRTIARFAGITSTLAVFLLTAPPAWSEHLFVSQFGNDAGDGSAFQPFRTLQGAINAANGGDTIQLEMGGDYGPGAIDNKSLTIISRQGGGIFNPDGPGLLITGTGGDDTITVDGLVIDQGGSANNGIQFNSGHKLNVVNTTIRNGSGGASGIFFQPNGNAELNVTNSIISNFGTNGSGSGIRIQPRQGADVTSVLNGVTLQNNRSGLLVSAGDGSDVGVVLEGSTVSGNSVVGVRGTGSRVQIFSGGSTIVNNARGVQSNNGAQVLSPRNNILINNTVNGAFTDTFGQK